MEIGNTQTSRAARAGVAASQSPQPQVTEPAGERAQRAARGDQSLGAREARELRTRTTPTPGQREARQERLEQSARQRAEREVREQELHTERRAERAAIESPGTLAVRTGPAPVEELRRPSADEALRASLDERARLVNLEAVMNVSGGAAEAGTRPDPTATGEPGELPELELPGSGDASAELPPLMGEGGAEEQVDETAPPRRPFEREPEPESRAETREPDEQRADAQVLARDAQPEHAPVHAERATAVAPQAAPLPLASQGSESEARSTAADAPEERRTSEAVAQRSLTQAGLVEAEAADAIVTRFIDGLPGGDAGPEPRPSEHLGERSSPPR